MTVPSRLSHFRPLHFPNNNNNQLHPGLQTTGDDTDFASGDMYNHYQRNPQQRGRPQPNRRNKPGGGLQNPQHSDYNNMKVL